MLWAVSVSELNREFDFQAIFESKGKLIWNGAGEWNKFTKYQGTERGPWLQRSEHYVEVFRTV